MSRRSKRLVFRRVRVTHHGCYRHTLRKWRCAHCPEVLSSQSSHIRHCQRKHSEHGYAKQRRGAKRRTSTSSSTSSIHSPAPTFPAGPQQEMKFDDVLMDTTYFVDAMTALDVQPLAVAVETSLLLHTTNSDTFDWLSWSINEKDWSLTEDPLAYITGVNLPDFDFEAELGRVQSELFSQSSPPPPPPSSYCPSSSSSAYSPPSSPHCGLHFAPPSPPASHRYYDVSTIEHVPPVFSPLLPSGWNFDPTSYSAFLYSFS